LRNPIPLPRGRYLVTLEDVGRYITRLPRAEHEAAESQIASSRARPGVWGRGERRPATLGRIAPRRSTVLAPRHAHEASWCHCGGGHLVHRQSTVSSSSRREERRGQKRAGEPVCVPKTLYELMTTPEALREAIRTVLDKPNYRSRAALMADEFAGIAGATFLILASS
jgi:hypothetical protein